MKKIFNTLLAADRWGHQHTALILTGLFIFGLVAFYQLLIPQMETHASYSPTWCTDNQGLIDIPLIECETLANIYASTDGDNWNSNANWFQTSTICGVWQGISCNYNTDESIYNIYSVDMQSNNMVGPVNMSGLAYLVGVNLADNQITAIDLTQNTVIENITLSLNQLTTIDLSQNPNLRSLSIDNNQLTSIDLSQNPNVQYLSLYNNQLTSIDVTQNTNLSMLDLSRNQLTSIDLTQNTALQSLSIETNRLSTIDLTQNINLTDISLPRNQLTAIDLTQNVNLQSIYIQQNQLTTIDLSQNTMLQSLGIFYNNIASIDLSNNINLTDLQIYNNNLTYIDLSNNTQLQYLRLRGNNLSGSIGSLFDGLNNLEVLDISFNNFDGPIPTSLANLPLVDLYIEGNCLDTDVSDENLLALLNSRPNRTSQYNCKANIDVQSQLSGSLTAGQCTPYTIYYENLGPQRAINTYIGQAFGEFIFLSGANPNPTTGLVGREYGTNNDPCYVNATQYATGPYFDRFENFLQTEYGFPSVYTAALYNGFTGTQGTTEFSYLLNAACYQAFVDIDDPYLCMLLFGGDMRNMNPSCGYGGQSGYIWELGTIPTGNTGLISMDICVASNASGSVTFTSMVDTISTNQNELSNNQSTGFMIYNPGSGSGYCGDGIVNGLEECDGGASCSYDCKIVQGESKQEGSQNNTGGGNNTGCQQTNKSQNTECNTGSPQSQQNDGDKNNTEQNNNTQQIRGNRPSSNIKFTIDSCPDGDFSPSYYDHDCGIGPKHNTADNSLINDPKSFAQEVERVQKSMQCNMSKELVESYVFAKSMGITTVTNICNADMLGPLKRRDLAKFSSVFTKNILQKVPDNTRKCFFTDVQNESNEMKAFITLSCEFANMGLNRDGTPDKMFRADDIVTRAEFAVVFSRMLYGSVNNTPKTDTRPRYDKHVQALKRDKIMTKIDALFEEEIRGYVMLMMMRAYQNIIQK